MNIASGWTLQGKIHTHIHTHIMHSIFIYYLDVHYFIYHIYIDYLVCFLIEIQVLGSRKYVLTSSLVYENGPGISCILINFKLIKSAVL